ncbi:MAG: NAD(P)H-hydrate dehydratase [Nitrospirota bacterium]|nr:NAD(P)H-hydrate dehydratase [Nitrospirota bacterium]
MRQGNNGGDGLALARRLRNRGWAVRVALLAPFASLKGEAKQNLSILRKTDVEILPNASATALGEVISWSDILVDALLGIGLSKPLKGSYSLAVELMNLCAKPVVAVDIPTGIDADTGQVLGSAVRACLTVTLGLPKRGLYLYPGADFAGKVAVADIGIPSEVIEKERVRTNVLDSSLMQDAMDLRERNGHKGDYGHLMVLAGSLGKAGAAVMTALGALRSGAGLVTVAAPAGIVPILQQQVFEAMCMPAGESIDGTLGMGAENEILKASAGMSAMAVGPGLTTHAETVQVVKNLLRRLQVPLVIDADGLNALAGSADILKGTRMPVIVTPHPGEMARLAGISSREVQNDRIGTASSFALKYGVTVVLKGAGTIVATPQGDVFLNTTGNPGMATAGTGDVLTGMIAGLLAQGYHTLEAACIGVHVHGAAGDLAAREKGEASMIAGDLIGKIPAAIRNITAAAGEN